MSSDEHIKEKKNILKALARMEKLILCDHTWAYKNVLADLMKYSIDKVIDSESEISCAVILEAPKFIFSSPEKTNRQKSEYMFFLKVFLEKSVDHVSLINKILSPFHKILV